MTVPFQFVLVRPRVCRINLASASTRQQLSTSQFALAHYYVYSTYLTRSSYCVFLSSCLLSLEMDNQEFEIKSCCGLVWTNSDSFILQKVLIFLLRSNLATRLHWLLSTSLTCWPDSDITAIKMCARMLQIQSTAVKWLSSHFRMFTEWWDDLFYVTLKYRQ